MRELMTHSAGLEETVKNLGFYDAARVPSMRQVLKEDLPKRIFPPGATVAYSNYGATLAGYIVQRLSGVSFADYVDANIFRPLGMTHSTFEQQLPPRLQGNVSKGYLTALGGAQPYEMIAMSPAGGLASSATDMAQFMMAHLQNGQLGEARILDSQTAELMHAHQRSEAQGINGFALGFYEESRNGQRIIGHSGDTQFFHSDLHLLLDAGTGLYLSLNSRGSDDAAYKLRTELFETFVDRYFPRGEPVESGNPKTTNDARGLTGAYISSERQDSNIFRVVTLLGETTISSDDKGSLTVSSLADADGEPYHWTEIRPSTYRQVNGASTLVFVHGRNGRVKYAAWSGDPTFVLQPAPMSENPWTLRLLIAASVLMLGAVVLWPIVYIVRKRHGVQSKLDEKARVLRRMSGVAAVLWITAGYELAHVDTTRADEHHPAFVRDHTGSDGLVPARRSCRHRIRRDLRKLAACLACTANRLRPLHR